MANASMISKSSSNFSTASPGSQGQSSVGSGQIPNQQWKRKFPIKPPLYVRVAGVISPSKYWCCEMPMLRSQKRKVPPGSATAMIFEIEEQLAEKYNKAEPKLHPEGEVTKAKPGMMVAVRPSYRSQCWYRGKVLTVMYKGEAVVKIFLVDYGDILDDINLRSCVRELTKRQALPKPLAFVVQLAGLRPISMKIDYENDRKSMTPIVAQKWSAFSQDLITNKVWEKSQKFGRLQNWRRGSRGHIHGELCVFGFKKEVNLNKLLVNGGHGEYFENLLERDLENRSFKMVAPKFTSICGPGQASGTKITDDSVDFTSADEEEVAKHTRVVDIVDPVERPPPEQDYVSFIDEEKFSKTVRKNTKKYNVLYSDDKPTATSSRRSSESEMANFANMSRLEIARALNQEDARARSTYWDTFREEDEFVDSDEEGDGKDKKETKDRQKSMYNQRQIVLPAGIDIGRFIVDSLDIMPDPIVGPKQIDTDFLKNPGMPDPHENLQIEIDCEY